MMNLQDDLQKRYQEAKTELMKIPGVLWVGYGTKEQKGELTAQSALRVYVREKRSIQELPPEQIIPDRFNGLLTDVLKIQTSRPLASCQDLSTHPKVIGGISISNLKDMKRALASGSGSSSDEFGTIGCVAIIDAEGSKDHFALLTNRHVLAANGGDVGDSVYQPRLKLRANGEPAVAEKPTSSSTPIHTIKLSDFLINDIAKIIDLGMEGNFPFTYPGEAPVIPEPEFYIDCASAKIRTDFSSWCNTNKGVDFANAIKSLNVGGKNLITKTGRLKAGDNGKKVFKVGRTTGRTVGEIVDPLGALGNSTTGVITHSNIIIIKATEPNCDGELRFSEHGDSGSVIITEDNEVVGLLFGDNSTSPTDPPIAQLRAHASHIHPVCARLGITPLTTEQNSITLLRFDSNPQLARVGLEIPVAVSIQERLSGSARGREFLELSERHRQELVHLVNHVRPVLVTWHRSKGAEYLTHFINSYRDPDYLVPAQIEGVSLKMTLMRMVEVLQAHGSRELIQSIDQYQDEVIGMADRVRKTEDLFAKLMSSTDA